MNERLSVRALGIDVGTCRIVVARAGGQQISYSTELNCFVSIPYSKITERILQKELIPYRVAGREILIYGNESEKFAFNREVRRPMRHGLLNPSERNSLVHVGILLESILDNIERGDFPVVFTTPAPPLEGTAPVEFHESSIAQILVDLGFQPRSISEGLAVVYSELADTNYTGIGISCGGGLCNVCVAYLSVPIMEYSLPYAGDFIDEAASAATGEPIRHVRRYKETSFCFNGHGVDQLHQAIAVYYGELFHKLADSLAQCLGVEGHLPPFDRPIPIVLSGGSSMPQGFDQQFAKALSEVALPVKIAEIRRARNPLYATAHGALQAALSEISSPAATHE